MMTKIIAYSLLITATSISVIFASCFNAIAPFNVSKNNYSISIDRYLSTDNNEIEIEELNRTFDKELSLDPKMGDLNMRLFEKHFHSKPMTK